MYASPHLSISPSLVLSLPPSFLPPPIFLSLPLCPPPSLLQPSVCPSPPPPPIPHSVLLPLSLCILLFPILSPPPVPPSSHPQPLSPNMTLDLTYSPVSIGKLRLWKIFAQSMETMKSLGMKWTLPLLKPLPYTTPFLCGCYVQDFQKKNLMI